jgi:hypothetical protein
MDTKDFSVRAQLFRARAADAACTAWGDRVQNDQVTGGYAVPIRTVAERTHQPGYLMSGPDRVLRARREPHAVPHVQVGSADPAGKDIDQSLAGPRRWQLGTGLGH